MEDFKIDPKFSQEIVHAITQSLYATGYFNDEDLKDKKSHLLAIKRLLDDGGIGNFVIDHTKSLITKAREYYKSEDYNYSKVFYATFFEHQVNDLIHLYCQRNDIDSKTQKSIIQSVNIWGKFTWLLQLMNYPKFNQKHLATIKKLADDRNSFVHYKWMADPESDQIIDPEEEEKKISSEFERIEKVVKYFKGYCSKLKFNGKKARIKKLTKY